MCDPQASLTDDSLSEFKKQPCREKQEERLSEGYIQ